MIAQGLRDGAQWFGRTMVHVAPLGSHVKLSDGRALIARPEDTDSYRAQARALGYGADTAAMCREHDYLHALLAHALGLSESPALRGAVEGRPTDALTGAEEDMVLAAQRFLNLWRARAADDNTPSAETVA